MAVLPDLTKLTHEQLQAKVLELMAKNQGARAGLKVTEKGAVSMYGLGRFPVTLYRSQWEKLLAHADEVKAFIEANKGRLSVKE